MSDDLSFLSKYKNRNVLIAPLNWGLGHATRCIPIIKKLAENNAVSIASDGLALEWLKRELREYTAFNLPSYNINYSSKFMWLNMLKLSPLIINAINSERRVTNELIARNGFNLIVSDHRLGVRNKKVESIIIAHQLRIPHPNMIASLLASRFQAKYINQFNECWIPDYQRSERLSGTMSELKTKIPRRFIGPVSRLIPCPLTKKAYDIAVILSGPEPSRTKLEQYLVKILAELSHLRIVLIRGTTLPIPSELKFNNDRISVHHLVDSEFLNHTLCKSKIVITRPGYSTIMDLHFLNLKAIFIPTPGHPEQVYLGLIHGDKNLSVCMNESDLSHESILQAVSRLM